MLLKNKTILITGGAGFIGSYTARALAELGAKIVVVDNLSTGKKANLDPSWKFFNVSVADEEVGTIFQQLQPDFVYHFAFNVNVPLSVENPLIEVDSITGSIRVFQSAKKNNVKKIIFASSEFIYGDAQEIPTTEDSPFIPQAPYAVSKFTVENYLRFFHHAFDLPYVIYRYSTVYGPQQIKGAMTDYIIKLANDQQAEIWGNGTKTRDYINIKDVVQANLLAIDIRNSDDNVFNVGTGKETSLNELYQCIAKILRKEPRPIYNPDRPGEHYRSCIDSSKLQKLTGWKPTVGLEKGLQEKIVSLTKTVKK